MADETLEAFFLLPIPRHPILLPDLMRSLDKCVQSYIITTKSHCGEHYMLTISTKFIFKGKISIQNNSLCCVLLWSSGSRGEFLPVIPDLTRCTAGSKLQGVFRKKDKLIPRRKPVLNEDNSGILQLCVRINTLHLIRKKLEVLQNRMTAHLRNAEYTHLDDKGKVFELSQTACSEGVQQLCVATAYKLIFRDLSPVFWDGLYLGEVSSSRIEPFLQDLKQYLEIISSTVHDRVRARLIADVMKASFDGFLLILLAGGPSRAYSVEDYIMIEEDFDFLQNFFCSSGYELPPELINRFALIVKRILPLFHMDTQSLIEQFRASISNEYGPSASSSLPLS